ncbi:MAG: HPr(Ser) kinase/phosphatase, partial [Clostridia bacterium]|nr:HPr(Ser) kinase/phosphatase [Clostridia bacterium]
MGEMISLESFAAALGLEVISPAPPSSMHINVADICRPGLQFAGYFDIFANERPQLIGKAEMAYLVSLPQELREKRLEKYFSFPMPCIVIARGMPCPDALLRHAKEHGVAIYSTQEETSAFNSRAIGFMSEVMAPRTTCHGVLVDVFGVGVMITGESGVGKSECGLELIKRGHLLVSDDVVDITRLGGKLRGESPEVVRDFMELRGIGIVDIKLIFGIGAVMRKKTIDMVIHLELWTPGKDY